MKLAGKIALITGGSRGIGRATALAFAAEGADIAFCHLNDDGKADETAGEIRALGRRAMHRSVDVADIASGRAFVGQAAREFGPIDILFNNAGINIRKPFEAYTEEEFDRIISVHLKGMFFMAQAVYPAMVARGQGCIINVASQRGLKGAVNSAPYSAAKAAIMGFTRALAWEATPKGVRVNAIAPGPIVTDLTATMTPEDRQAFIDALPVGRFGRPEEIAATALLLAGPDGGFYVGATLSPNGGDVMKSSKPEWAYRVDEGPAYARLGTTRSASSRRSRTHGQCCRRRSWPARRPARRPGSPPGSSAIGEMSIRCADSPSPTSCCRRR